MDDPLRNERFPRSGKYQSEWMMEHPFGANPVWLAEWLAEQMDFERGMRVLDLGCGRAKSSLFLAAEFEAQVWATDLWISASENWSRIRDAALQDRVFPIHADARDLPFSEQFFDAIVAHDTLQYYGTDDLYLNYLAQFVKPGGKIGIASAGLMREFDGPTPDHLKRFWTQDAWCLHTADWWRNHWERTGLVKILGAETLSDGWRAWLQWNKALGASDWYLETIETDAGRYLGYVRIVAERVAGEQLAEHAWPATLRTLPVEFRKTTMRKP